jgi:hypothetical protein
MYGIHSARPAGTATADGVIYVENDRGSVTYQLQNGVWRYLSGTMFGTLSPDQRPTDLGVNDGGFDFRGTDQQREFLWSQTAWIEITPQPQTPWQSNIDGAGHSLTNISALGIGTASPQARLDSAGMIRITDLGPVPTSVAALEMFYYPPTPKAVIEAYDRGTGLFKTLEINGDPLTLQMNGGRCGIGMVPSYQLQLSTDSAAKPGTSTWNVASDARLKENVQPVTDDSLRILESLDWIRFEYNGSAQMPKGLKTIGLSAQKLQEHLPEAVRGVKGKLTESDPEETELLGIDYHHILVHTARAIQQLSAEIKALKQKQ